MGLPNVSNNEINWGSSGPGYNTAIVQHVSGPMGWRGKSLYPHNISYGFENIQSVGPYPSMSLYFISR